MNSDLTIIVPVYKIKEEYLRQCIESLVNQDNSNYKIILVDDGSPDNCGLICDEYAAKNKCIRVVHQPNQGVSAARNAALEIADTKWITFVDADDWIANNYVSQIYKELEGEAKEADIILFDYIREFKNSRPIDSLQFNKGYLTYEEIQICKRATFYKLLIAGKFNPYEIITLWNKVYRLSFLKEHKVSFVLEALKGQDRLFNADAINSTSKLYYFPEPLYHYRCFRTSRTNKYDPKIPQLTVIELDSLRRIVEKHNIATIANEYIKCRVCTRLYVNLRLFYFHSQNPNTFIQKINNVSELVKTEPYKSALQTVNLNLLSFQERLFVYSIKYKLYVLTYLLVKIKDGLFTKKLF